MSKIISKEKFRDEVRPAIKAKGQKIALCHGVFDLVHPGHLTHLKQAKAAADVLVVSITAAEFVRKGPGRPYFDDRTRMEFLEAIDCVDYVMLSEGYTVNDIVEVVEPDLYVKGEEYAKEDEDLTGKMREERELVERHGGRVYYTTGQVYSSTKLINTALSGLSEEVRTYMLDFRKRHSLDEIKGYVDAAEKLKILVVGEVIIDRYTYCSVQGLISKEASYSARLLSSEDYPGGALAVARHLATFTPNVTLLSIVGNEPEMKQTPVETFGGNMTLNLIQSPTYPTIVKHRYLIPNDKREEYRKVFTINNIPQDQRMDEPSVAKFKDFLMQRAAEYDAVFICDFGHGLMDAEAIRILQDKARYLALNCQTNSSNMGMNIITKYTRADAFSLDQKELKLAFSSLASDEEGALRALSAHLRGNGWLTRGSAGAWGIERRGAEYKLNDTPAYTLRVKDTVGAGDAFYAVACVSAAAGATNEAALFLGNIAGALGANIVGNKEPVEKINVLKYASTLMNV